MTYQKRSLKGFSLLLTLFIILFITQMPSCKKADILAEKSGAASEKSPENFFKLPAGASPVLYRIAHELERQNKTREFVRDFIARDGFPVWNNASIEKNGHKIKGNSSLGFDGEGLEDTVVYIPLVVNDQHYVHGFLKATIEDTVEVKIFRQNDYVNFPFQIPLSTPTVTTAENYALRMMMMDKDVFGSNEFKVVDKRMFNNSTDYRDTANIQRFIKLDTTSGGNHFSNGTTVNSYEYELCYTVVTYYPCPTFAGSGNNIQGPCESYSEVCITYETGGEGGGSSWPFPPGGGGGGGNPGGDGGGPACEYFGANIVNSVVPIECEPGPGGNPWPQQTGQNWLDLQWMTNKVKDSTNSPCVANVLQSLRQVVSKLPQLLRSVFDTSAASTNNFEMTLKMASLGTFEGGATVPNFSDFKYTVNINSFFNDATDLSVASTIIHEAFHCQLLAWFRQCYTLNDTAKQRELTEKYGYIFTRQVSFDSVLAIIAQGSGPLQHQDIAVRYRDIIGQALYEFAQGRGINVTLNYCKDLAWAGCTDSRAFLALSNSTQADIVEKVNAEKDPYGNTVNDPFTSPKGTPCL